MPQRGGLRLAVFALTCAVGLVAAGSASANEIVLEAGATHMASGSSATVDVPPGLVLKQALLTRSTTFPEGSGGAYSATFKWYTGPDTARVLQTQVLDSATTTVAGDVTKDADASGPDAGGSIAFAVTGAGASADLQRIGLKVDDPEPPSGMAVGGIGPNGNIFSPDPDHHATTTIDVWGNDNGVGLWKAELYVDGVLVGKFEYVDASGAGRNCVDAVDHGTPLPLKNDCLHNYSQPKGIEFDSTRWPDGSPLPDGAHTATIKVYDASGGVDVPMKDAPFEIKNHRDPSNCSPTCDAPLSIGSGGISQQNGSRNGNNGSGGVAGESTTSCNSPRLSMELSQKPLKVSKSVPVLVSGKRYRFRGRLTCLIGGKRRSAAPKTPIELLNTIGKRTYRKGGATVRSNGAITLILAYKSSRTLVFRYTNPDGRRSQVKLKIKVVKKSR